MGRRMIFSYLKLRKIRTPPTLALLTLLVASVVRRRHGNIAQSFLKREEQLQHLIRSCKDLVTCSLDSKSIIGNYICVSMRHSIFWSKREREDSLKLKLFKGFFRCIMHTYAVLRTYDTRFTLKVVLATKNSNTWDCMFSQKQYLAKSPSMRVWWVAFTRYWPISIAILTDSTST